MSNIIQEIGQSKTKYMTNDEVVRYFKLLHNEIENHELECRCEVCLYFDIIGTEKRLRGIDGDGEKQKEKDSSWSNTLRDGSRRVTPRPAFQPPETCPECLLGVPFDENHRHVKDA